MNQLILYSTLFVLFLLPFEGHSTNQIVGKNSPHSICTEVLDSLFNRVNGYEHAVTGYEANLYIKGKIDIQKQNYFIKHIPGLFRFEKGVKQYMIESLNEVTYSAPNTYNQKTKALIGTLPRNYEVPAKLLGYIHINVYTSSLLQDVLLSPLAQNARKYYNYQLDSTYVTEGRAYYQIAIKPKHPSSQLVEGSMIVSDQYTVSALHVSGFYNFTRFQLNLVMGIGDQKLLPVQVKLITQFTFLKNQIEATYSSQLHYTKINMREPNNPFFAKKELDLSQHYVLKNDTSRRFTDPTYFAANRPTPLEADEFKIYQDHALRKDSSTNSTILKHKNGDFFGDVGDLLLSSYSLNISKSGNIRTAPLFNPLLLNYSKRDGLAYKQSLVFNHFFSGSKILRINPSAGYAFQRNELYVNLSTLFNYKPRMLGSVSFDIGNGKRIYSSELSEFIQNSPDSINQITNQSGIYFRDFYTYINHNIELFNGFYLTTGISSHRRTSVDRFTNSTVETDGTITYSKPTRAFFSSFAPRIKLSYTPRQYYYFSGKRKVNLPVSTPTFTLDYERGIKGILQSSGSFERIEAEVQQQLKLGLMRQLNYRLGVGAFTNKESLYFVDFLNFSYSNLPIGWNDKIGGAFQTLDSRWYNVAARYAQFHATYDAPFLFLNYLPAHIRSISNERIYVGALYTANLKPFIEIGYGIGTHIFDAGVFVNYNNGKIGEYSFKITLELFNK